LKGMVIYFTREDIIKGLNYITFENVGGTERFFGRNNYNKKRRLYNCNKKG